MIAQSALTGCKTKNWPHKATKVSDKEIATKNRQNNKGHSIGILMGMDGKVLKALENGKMRSKLS